MYPWSFLWAKYVLTCGPLFYNVVMGFTSTPSIHGIMMSQNATCTEQKISNRPCLESSIKKSCIYLGYIFEQKYDCDKKLGSYCFVFVSPPTRSGAQKNEFFRQRGLFRRAWKFLFLGRRCQSNQRANRMHMECIASVNTHRYTHLHGFWSHMHTNACAWCVLHNRGTNSPRVACVHEYSVLAKW